MVRPYLALNFTVTPLQPATEILIAELADLGFESFEETATGLLAYIPEVEAPKNIRTKLAVLRQSDFKISFTTATIAPKNWNAKWENNFKPVNISSDCAIRAPFHSPTTVPFEIIIQPKMSFGTGHHPTTTLMLRQLLDMDCKGKKVLDMGTGTGVLAILAEKKGAASIDAFDIDTWSIENCQENFQLNHCTHINAQLGDIDAVSTAPYDLILANINRNVLLNHIPYYAKMLSPWGRLILSGFYQQDLEILQETTTFNALELEKHTVADDNWTAAIFKQNATQA